MPTSALNVNTDLYAYLEHHTDTDMHRGIALHTYYWWLTVTAACILQDESTLNMLLLNIAII